MGVLNNALGMNLTNHDPLIDSPLTDSQSNGFVAPPPSGDFFLLLDGSNFNLLDSEFFALL